MAAAAMYLAAYEASEVAIVASPLLAAGVYAAQRRRRSRRNAASVSRGQ